MSLSLNLYTATVLLNLTFKKPFVNIFCCFIECSKRVHTHSNTDRHTQKPETHIFFLLPLIFIRVRYFGVSCQRSNAAFPVSLIKPDGKYEKKNIFLKRSQQSKQFTGLVEALTADSFHLNIFTHL